MHNPISISPAVLADARHHCADHCPQCHANDGSWQDLRPGSRVIVHLTRDGKALEVHLPARK